MCLPRRNRFRPCCEPLEDRVVPAAGQPDPTFGPDGTGKATTQFDVTTDLTTLDLGLDSQGRVVAVSTGGEGNTTGDFAVVAYTPDGLPDASFGPGGTGVHMIRFDATGFGDVATAVAFQTVNGQEKILVAGSVSKNGSSTDTDFAVVRLNSDGLLDTAFGNGGSIVIPFDLGGTNQDEPLDLVVDRFNRIVVAGYATRDTGDTDFAVVRLTASGQLDGTFGDGVSGTGRSVIAFNNGPAGQREDVGRGVAMQGDNIIVVGSLQRSDTNKDFAVTRLLPSGRVDTSFGPVGGSSGKVYISFVKTPGVSGLDLARKVVVQPDGQLLIVGEAETGPGNADFGITRLQANGEGLDNSFGGDGLVTINFRLGGNNADIGRAIALQDDGRIIVAGEAMTDLGRDFAIARLLPTGDLDPAFSTAGMATVKFDHGRTNDDTASGLAIQPDGNLVVGGLVASRDFGTELGLVRLQGNSLGDGGGGFDLGELFSLPPDLGLPVIPAARNVTPLLSIVRARMGRKGKGKSRFVIRIRNASGADLSGGLILVIDGLRRASRVRLRGALGTTLSEPPINSPFQLLNIPGGMLRAGEETEAMVSFVNPLGVNIRFTERVMNGSPDLL